MILLPYIFALCLVSIEIWAVVYVLRTLGRFRISRLLCGELLAIAIGVVTGIILSNQYSRFWTVTYSLSRSLKVIGLPFPIGFFRWEDFGGGDYDWKDYIAPAYYMTANIIIMTMIPHCLLAIVTRQWIKARNEK